MSDKKMTEASVVDSEAVQIQDMAESLSAIEVKNTRIGKVLKLQEEAERQNELERQRSRRIRQEQEYIDKMITSVEKNLRSTREEQKYNEEFEQQIREQIYRMHGISEDKLFGMKEARKAWYQGAAFALFFLSLALIVLCGALHGFGSELCIFMAFYTAIEGTLLSNGRKQSVLLDALIKVLYLLLFPVMMVAFVCYEMGFEEYDWLVSIFTVTGVIVLMIGAVSYFLYDPYRVDRRNRKKADSYIREMEKTALKEVRLKEKTFEKQERKREKQAKKEEKKQKQTAERKERKEQRKAEREEKKVQRDTEREEKKEQRAVERATKKEEWSIWWAEKVPGSLKTSSEETQQEINEELQQEISGGPRQGISEEAQQEINEKTRQEISKEA